MDAQKRTDQANSSISAGRPNDWIGGCGYEQQEEAERARERMERMHDSKGESGFHSDRPNEWMGAGKSQGFSPIRRDSRKAPIKIEGYQNTIKNNPFMNK
jgi:hypothetical protein